MGESLSVDETVAIATAAEFSLSTTAAGKYQIESIFSHLVVFFAIALFHLPDGMASDDRQSNVSPGIYVRDNGSRKQSTRERPFVNPSFRQTHETFNLPYVCHSRISLQGLSADWQRKYVFLPWWKLSRIPFYVGITLHVQLPGLERVGIKSSNQAVEFSRSSQRQGLHHSTSSMGNQANYLFQIVCEKCQSPAVCQSVLIV